MLPNNPNGALMRKTIGSILKSEGVAVNVNQRMPLFVKEMAVKIGVDRAANESEYQYMYRWLSARGLIKSKESTRYQRKFEPMSYRPHPRQSEIDAAQPPMIAITGVQGAVHAPFNSQEGDYRTIL